MHGSSNSKRCGSFETSPRSDDYRSSSCSDDYGSASHSDDSESSSYTSSMSTPRKIGTNWLPSHARRDMDKVLQSDLSGYRYEDVTVQEFVEQVWGLKPDLAARILVERWTLDPSALKDYKNIVANSPEPQLHLPFRKIFKQLLDDAIALLGISPTEVCDDFWDKQGNSYIKSQYADRKPDMLRMWNPIQTKAQWSLVKCVVEFKKRRKGKRMGPILEDTEDVDSTTTSFSAAGTAGTDEMVADEVVANQLGAGIPQVPFDMLPVAEASLPPPLRSSRTSSLSQPDSSTGEASTSAMPPSKSRKKSKTKKNRPPSLPALRDASLDGSVTPDVSSGEFGKRKRDSDDDASSVDPKRQKSLVLTLFEVQLASYAVECLAVANRQYATGIFIDSYTTSLWYYDRHAVFRTATFDFSEQPQLLALVAFGLARCDMRHAGFNPYFSVTLPSPPPTVLESEMEKADTPEDDHVESPNNPLIPLVDRPVSALKNCYVVFPRPDAGNDEPPPVCFIINNVLQSYYGITGRGTSVFLVQEVIGGNVAADELALKISWQHTFRTKEGDIIDKLRKDIPAWKDHLPDLRFHASYSPKDLDLPWTRMNITKPDGSDIQPRSLNATAEKKYIPLWEAGGIKEFKQAFLDCVECHYHAWKDGKVLHRDLSEKNLMIDIIKPGGRLKTRVKGIVNDWDMASILTDQGEVPTSLAKHRTGTAPFMAYEVLDVVGACLHRYRHDLESLFYILIWAAIHYDLENKKQVRDLPGKPKVHPAVANWTKDGLASIWIYKGAFLALPTVRDRVLKAIGKEFKDLENEWIRPLWKMFKEVGNVPDPSSEEAKTYDYVTCDGAVTFEKFMATIKETPRGKGNRDTVA